MAFKQATALIEQRNKEILSADNSIPERHIVVELIRNAAPRIGISASVISTLDAMLSCLAPKRNHHTVFASNATLTFRRNGISDRTIRRHVAALQEAGLLVRHDSPNRKRYTKHSHNEGASLRFGFDLTPLFDRLLEIAAIAADVLRENEQIAYLKTKIRSAVNSQLLIDPNDLRALETLRVLRRKLSLQNCQKILSEIGIGSLEAESVNDQQPQSTVQKTGRDGQNVRLHHRSNKELNDKGMHNDKRSPNVSESEISVAELLIICPEAASFSLRKIVTSQDVIALARTLAPMIGITNQNYEMASNRLGAFRTAATVWAIMQFHTRINSVGAYFRSITTGSKRDQFSPERLINQIRSSQRYAA